MSNRAHADPNQSAPVFELFQKVQTDSGLWKVSQVEDGDVDGMAAEGAGQLPLGWIALEHYHGHQHTGKDCCLAEHFGPLRVSRDDQAGELHRRSIRHR
jgi:hypothetical protein